MTTERNYIPSRTYPITSKPIKEERQFLALCAKHGYPKPKQEPTASYYVMKLRYLYPVPEIKRFLDKHTAFLPKSATGIQRWTYYKNGETKPHACFNCGAYIENYTHRYCSHECSTKHRDPEAKKTGPKIDLGKKERALKQRLRQELPAYKLHDISTYPRVTLKHSCGKLIEMNHDQVFKNNGKKRCPCTHVRVMKHTLETLKAKYAEMNSVWVPVKFEDGSDVATFRNRKCRHKAELPHARWFDLRCSVCHPNKFATNVITPKEYRQQVKVETNAAFKVIDDYVGASEYLRFKHTCGGITKTTPTWFKQSNYRCASCSPRTSGSLHEYFISDRTLLLRGKEAVAIKWIIENSKITIDDIVIDSSGDVPRIKYKDNEGTARRYRPDFFIAHRNLLIEVKSPGTIGFTKIFFYMTGEQLWDTNCAKARAAREAGYQFKMLVFDAKNNRIPLPKGWYNMTRKQVLKRLKQKGHL